VSRDGRRELEELDAVCRALAHPSRRQILLVLRFRGGEMTAGDIADRFSCTWPTTSRHLGVLRKAGLLTVNRQGRERIYRLERGFITGTLDRFIDPFREVEVPRPSV